jgi:release factor glutamine methyltransferase
VALFAGPDGLSVLRRIIGQAPDWLAVGGLLACEIGEGQRASLFEMAADLSPEIIKDLAGRDRFLIAQKGMA